MLTGWAWSQEIRPAQKLMLLYLSEARAEHGMAPRQVARRDRRKNCREVRVH